MMPDEAIAAAWSLIDREELADLAVTLGRIESPPGSEGAVAAEVVAWLEREGFHHRSVALLPERPNVIGMLKGEGGGLSLLFNSHMDIGATDPGSVRDVTQDILRTGWREGDILYGNGVVNDKGPLACFLIAAKAIKQSGVPLLGDLLLTAVSGEIEWEPVDEFRSPEFVSHDIGARFMVAHGAVADYALVAEATDLRLGWVMAGRAIYRIRVDGGPRRYSPYVERPVEPRHHPNAIVRAALLVSALEEWALRYERERRFESSGGTVVPRVNIGAIRGGSPYATHATSEQCDVHLDLRLAPGQDMGATQQEIEVLVEKAGISADVELLTYRRGWEAEGAERVIDAVRSAHERLLGEVPSAPSVPENSMWRDINVFNEAGIPCVHYGPGGGSGGGNLALPLDEAVKAAKVYAGTAIAICMTERGEST